MADLDRDCTAVGTLADLADLDRKTIRRLLDAADTTYLQALQRSAPDEAFELLIGGDVISLWLADRRVSVIART